MRIRGPGDFAGARQSGFPDFKVAQVSDSDLLMIARGEAVDILTNDPSLSSPHNRELRKKMGFVRSPNPTEIS